MTPQEMTAQIADGNGFIAALDQSGGSTPKALRGYGVDDSEWSGDEEMFTRIHEMRARVITSPSFGAGKVIGAILFERTMDGEVDGKPTADALKDRGIVPFIKVDQGLAEEEDGVQLMKPLDRLPALMEKAVSQGMFGTKMRSVIKSANAVGIARIVEQQFAVGNQIADAGLMPTLEPEFDITAPATAGLYTDIIAHPNVLKVVALSGGYSTDDACAHLAHNPGMLASFSRGLLQDLRKDQSDQEFDAALGRAIDQIHAASVAG